MNAHETAYEAAVDQWKASTAETAAPPIEAVASRLAGLADPEVVSPRRALAVGLSLAVVIAGFLGMAVLESVAPIYSLSPWSGRSVAVILPIAALAVAITWVRRRDLAAQMMVRALAWSALVIGCIISVFGRGVFNLMGPFIVMGAGTALLLLGGRGLGMSSPLFRPLAFRNHLLLALVLATADAGTLLFGATMQIGMGVGRGSIEYLVMGVPTMICGLVMAAAVGGIYRLRTWALVLNLFANVAIAFLAMSGYLGLTIPVATALAATATIQLLLPVPILAAALGDPLRDRRPLGKLGAPAMRIGLVVLMVVGVLGPLAPHQIGPFTIWREGWVASAQRTWVRGLDPVKAQHPPRRGVPKSRVDPSGR